MHSMCSGNLLVHIGSLDVLRQRLCAWLSRPCKQYICRRRYVHHLRRRNICGCRWHRMLGHALSLKHLWTHQFDIIFSCDLHSLPGWHEPAADWTSGVRLEHMPRGYVLLHWHGLCIGNLLHALSLWTILDIIGSHVLSGHHVFSKLLWPNWQLVSWRHVVYSVCGKLNFPCWG